MLFLDSPIEFDLEGLPASDCVDQKEQGAHASKQTKRTMAAGKSVAEELLNALKQPKLCPKPSYISEADTVSVDDFMQSRYARDYVLDTSNIHWGGELNANHVFDIYAGYHLSRDSNKV